MTFDEFADKQTLRISGLWFDAINKLYTEVPQRLAQALKKAEEGYERTGRDRQRDKEELDIFFFLLMYDLLDDTDVLVGDIFKETTIFSHDAAQELYRQTGAHFTPYDKDQFLQDLTKNRVDRYMADLKEKVPPPDPPAGETPTPKEAADYTKSTAVKAIDSRGVARDIPDWYQKELDRAIESVRSGELNYTEAIKRAVKALTDGGIVRVGYENGKPVNRSIEAVARQNVLDAISELAGKVTLANIIDLHPPYVDTSFHIGARTDGSGTPADHLAWSGRRFVLSDEFWREYGNKEDLLK